jgi:competence protein ComFC
VIGRRSCECAYLPPEINRMSSVYPFNGWIRDAIHRLKFEGERARAPMLASQVVHIEHELQNTDGIVPVPMHPRRMAARGFNQSELLALHISESYGIPILRALERIEDRGSQVGRNSPDRWKAVEGVFACSNVKQIRNRRLIVLDDVITTGATVSSCAQELIRSGAAEVRGLSLARG